jgi:hypothetical protein
MFPKFAYGHFFLAKLHQDLIISNLTTQYAATGRAAFNMPSLLNLRMVVMHHYHQKMPRFPSSHFDALLLTTVDSIILCPAVSGHSSTLAYYSQLQR